MKLWKEEREAYFASLQESSESKGKPTSSFEIRESFFLKQGRCFLLGRAASALQCTALFYTHLSTMKEPILRTITLEVLERRRDLTSPLPLEYCAPEENSKVPYPRLHQSSYLIYDTAFIPDRWGKFDKPTRDKGKCLFYQDPTRALTYVFDMNGKQTSHIRVPLVRPHAQKKYKKIPASELNAFQGTSPKADKSVDSKPLLKTMLYKRQKGICPSCGETLLSKKTTSESSRRVYRCTLWWWTRLELQTRAYWSTPQRNVVNLGVESPLEEEYNLHRDLPQVTFLRELMLRQKVCFAKKKNSSTFQTRTIQIVSDSSQFSHFFI